MRDKITSGRRLPNIALAALHCAGKRMARHPPEPDQGQERKLVRNGGVWRDQQSAMHDGMRRLFKIARDGTESVLYNFCSQSACADGQQSTSGLLPGKNGFLTGTTNLGGANGRGTLFAVK